MLLLPTPDIIDWQAELDGLIELEGTAPRKEGNIGHRTNRRIFQLLARTGIAENEQIGS